MNLQDALALEKEVEKGVDGVGNVDEARHIDGLDEPGCIFFFPLKISKRRRVLHETVSAFVRLCKRERRVNHPPGDEVTYRRD